MEISIIIPVYNREKWVMRTLQSVYAQTYRPLHIILVDNCSTDGTLALLEQFKRECESPGFRVSIAEEPRQGAAAARNRGMDLADSEWILFFDSDDEMLPLLVESYVAAAEKNPQADIVYTDMKIVDDSDGREQIKRSPSKNILYGNVFHTYLSTQRYMARKILVETAGRWNPRLLGWNDWELSLRLLCMSPQTVKLSAPAPLVLVHAHDDSITGRHCSDKAEIWEISVNAAETVVRESGRKDTDLLLDCLEYKRIMLAGSYTREGSAEGKRLYREVDARVRYRPVMRFLCWTGYQLTRRGVRGTARLAELLFRIWH